MTEQNVELGDPRILHRTAEPLAHRYTGVFFPELVERCVAEAHAALARTARIQTYLGPMALHAAGDRLRVLARAKGSASAPVRQVLFVDAHDTGPAQIAAGMLAHHPGPGVVTRSAGVDPGAAVDPFARGVLTRYGIDRATPVPRPLTEDLVQAADWVITIGPQDLGLTPSGTIVQTWAIGGSLDENFLAEDDDRSLVAGLDDRVQALWVEITSSPEFHR
jgi:arsenate reductase